MQSTRLDNRLGLLFGLGLLALADAAPELLKDAALGPPDAGQGQRLGRHSRPGRRPAAAPVPEARALMNPGHRPP